MANSHFVPRLVLRQLGDKISLFNVRTDEFKEDVRIEKAFSENNFYSEEIEKKLNSRIESKFGSLFHNKILKTDKIIQLKRNELYIVKKFLLVSTLRAIDAKDFVNFEKSFYDIFLANLKRMYPNDFEFLKELYSPPFKEKDILGETDFDYWMRTLDCILESDGTPAGIAKLENATYAAYRWSVIINSGYLAFWDSEFDHDEFVITDIGMTSENEKGWNGITVHNNKKRECVSINFENTKDDNLREQLAQLQFKLNNFHENFMMFPISNRRMIVLINPFYKFRIDQINTLAFPKLSDLSYIENEDLYYPNDAKYVLPQNEAPLRFNYHDDDLYIYYVKKLSRKETRYCNSLFLDRISNFVGFSSLDKAVGSFNMYYRLTENGRSARVDYSKMYKIISDRFKSQIG